MNLTARQTDVAVAIRSFRRIHGYAPTLPDLMAMLGLGKMTVHEHIQRLIAKRVLRRGRSIRSLEIVRDDLLPPERRTLLRFPVMGTIG